MDEIADISPSIQAKLLRVLQENEVRRVGDNRPILVDVRIIAATNRELEEAMEQGKFRSDLYYRVNVIPIHIPPLRERKEDIPLLVAHFLEKINRKMGRRIELSDHAMARIMAHQFPGNVRELENLIEQTVALADVDQGEVDVAPDAHHSSKPERRTLNEIVQDTERRVIEQMIARLGGRMDLVARQLGLSTTTLWRKMKRYGISR